jgi:hypothetical protein
MNFLQTDTSKESPSKNQIKNSNSDSPIKIIKNNIRGGSTQNIQNKNNYQEEEMKQEFEDKFSYLLNKLDVIYQISNK